MKTFKYRNLVYRFQQNFPKAIHIQYIHQLYAFSGLFVYIYILSFSFFLLSEYKIKAGSKSSNPNTFFPPNNFW